MPLLSHTCRFQLKFMSFIARSATHRRIRAQQPCDHTKSRSHPSSTPRFGHQCSHWAGYSRWWEGGKGGKTPFQKHTSFTKLPHHILFQMENLHIFSTAQHPKDIQKKKAICAFNHLMLRTNTRFGVWYFSFHVISRDWKVWYNLKL